jgi:hypothetical protein
MGKLIEEETKTGALLATGGFLPSPKDVGRALTIGTIRLFAGR